MIKLARFAALIALPFAAAAAQAQRPPAPKLIVAISVDQFSADLFAQYRQHFTGGLARLARGVVFPAGYQSHGATETCPGHSTILTGSRPARTGIIANDWFDLDVGRNEKRIYCAEDEREAESSPANPVVSSFHLRVPTLGDHMKRANPASRVVVVSGKDRSAVMMGGHDPDQRWWWWRGAFKSHDEMATPPAVARENQRIAGAMTRSREPFPLPAVCEARSREIRIDRSDRRMGTGRFARGPLPEARRDEYRYSPDLDAAVLAIASGLRDDMGLGERQATDLLILGLSATDYVGHNYGTQGSEMCIQLVELDRMLGSFFDRLDATGIDYAVMLTADHGGLDIPERARQQATGEAARSLEPLEMREVNRRLRRELGLQVDPLVGEYASGDRYVNIDLPPEMRQRVLDAAILYYRDQPQVAAVLTRAEIEATPAPSGPPETWTLPQRARASYAADRSGDLLVVLDPRITPIFDTSRGYVATHGSPWDYDRRVPILFWRRGMTPFEQPMSVETVDILPTLAALIGVTIPAGTIDGRCLDLIEGPESSCPE